MCLQIIVFNVISLITDKTHFQSCASLTVFGDKLNWQLLSKGKKKKKTFLSIVFIFFPCIFIFFWCVLVYFLMVSRKYESEYSVSGYQLWKSLWKFVLPSSTFINEYLILNIFFFFSFFLGVGWRGGMVGTWGSYPIVLKFSSWLCTHRSLLAGLRDHMWFQGLDWNQIHAMQVT